MKCDKGILVSSNYEKKKRKEEKLWIKCELI